MAGRLHSIDTHGPTQRIVSTREPYAVAEGFGTKIPEGVSGSEILELSNTAFDVSLVPATANGIVIPETFAVVPGDTGSPFAGTVGKKYETFQNTECMAFVEALGAAGGADFKFEAAGTLKDRAICWWQAKLPEGITIRDSEWGPDNVEMFLWMLTSHVGETSFIAKFTANRPFCNNQIPSLIANNGNTNMVKISHTRHMRDRVAQARKVLAEAMGFFEQHVTEMRELDAIDMNAAEFRTFAEKLIGDTEASIAEAERTITERTSRFREARIDRLEELFTGGRGNVGRTRFDALNAVTELADHHVCRHSAESRFRAVVMGESEELKGRAAKLLIRR